MDCGEWESTCKEQIDILEKDSTVILINCTPRLNCNHFRRAPENPDGQYHRPKVKPKSFMCSFSDHWQQALIKTSYEWFGDELAKGMV